MGMSTKGSYLYMKLCGIHFIKAPTSAFGSLGVIQPLFYNSYLALYNNMRMGEVFSDEWLLVQRIKVTKLPV